MQRPKLLHQLLKGIIDATSFIVIFDTMVDNGDGTYTLSGICDFHYIQPGFAVHIPQSDMHGAKSNQYTVISYDDSALTLTVSGSVLSLATSFTLLNPYFFHGTPVEQDIELKQIDTPNDKTPMIYLMEPYETQYDYTVQSNIDRHCDFTLCFLTQSNPQNWVTDDFYYNAITPMKNLFEDMMLMLINSNLFYDVKQKAKPKFYTRFGINVRDFGAKKMYFSENLSGVGVDLHLDIYKDDSCGCGDAIQFLQSSQGEYIQVD